MNYEDMANYLRALKEQSQNQKQDLIGSVQEKCSTSVRMCRIEKAASLSRNFWLATTPVGPDRGSTYRGWSNARLDRLPSPAQAAGPSPIALSAVQ